MKKNHRQISFFILTVILMITTTSSPTLIEGEMIPLPETNRINLNPVVLWNNLTTTIAIKEKLSPPELSRAYALVHISIYDALLANNWYQGIYDIERSTATTAGAASTILSYLFPDYVGEINKVKKTHINEISIPLTQNAYKETIRERVDFGEIVGKQIARFAAYQIRNNISTDNLGELVKDNILSGACIWNGSNPVLPTAGTWKTFILKSGSEIQPPDPEICGSYKDINDLNETYQARLNITPEQIEAVHYWGDRLPPVIWNDLLNKRILKTNMSIFDAAYASSYLNIGMYDGFVSCWYTKYDHWTARPFQRISNFSTVIPTPNFPSYTSGHSVISSVASKILGEIFPNEKQYFEGLAEEASLSRFWAGIHFKQDVMKGIDQGMNIGHLVIEDMNNPLHFFVFEDE